MKQKPTTVTDTQAKLLPKLTLAFFSRPRITALLWIAITLFGIVSYTTLLKRDGFPSISIPIVIVNGTYGVNDAAVVDKSLAAPVTSLALKQPGVKSVSSESGPNFMSLTVQYDESVQAADAKQKLQTAIDQNKDIPSSAKLTLGAPYFGVTGGSIEKVDATISLYSTDPSVNITSLVKKSQQAAEYMQARKPSQVSKFSVASPFQSVLNPANGQTATVQRSFDRFGERAGDKNIFHESVIINVASVPGADVIKLDDQIRKVLADYQVTPEAQGIRTAVSASYAPSIKDSISELQRVLLEGLLAVLVIGSIVIAVRASFITVISMITVIAATVAVVYLVGYTLNVITLFALILGLALIVDDTIIMVEAIDNARRRTTDKRAAVEEATRKISRAMVAATLTAALSFAPLIFVGGVLGSFIRAIPVTIISALLISLVVALIFIPLFARWLLLGKKQMGQGRTAGGANAFEARLAKGIVRPMLWARHSRPKEFTVGIAAVVIGLAFVLGGGYVFQKVEFNIFPPSKDTNQLAVAMTFPPDTSVEQAAAIASRADDITSQVLGANFAEASYYGMANNRTAMLSVELTPYSQREATAPQLVDALKARFKDFPEARVTAYPLDVGPPSSGFKIDITATDRQQATRLSQDMTEYLNGRKLMRPSGKEATITEVSLSNTSVYQRSGERQILSVTAMFDGTDTTTLTTLAKAAVSDHYDNQRLAAYGLTTSDISFDLGQESENQDSFKALAVAFPLVLLAIYILLFIQFRSLLQPLLIFMALPFSFFGIALGLYFTNNAFSFFSMLGFFALIGLSIKNTILLTDYANQARRAGLPAVDAAVAALGERFRPLVATSLTAVVSLIPLALTSPFWQSLAVTLIFGLLSSTFLVITVFPYYYLGGEYLRMKISRKLFLGWLALNLAVCVALGMVIGPVAALIGFVVLNVALIATAVIRRRQSDEHPNSIRL
ncbi:MAG TPA: efflux RND transporter permease subunit [Candidatus Saccharimonadales bacterium]|jgi:HAE1 family hydrophobic/amphiphilic exporter-1